ncbi:TPA: restriction endonuclease subunit S [Vibrio cholerae]|uniref:restriction endonuclease subunit S n=1 Tax=Vibrio cholerae TaxID=666 RepID=UPI0018F0E23D|nr:restriction endonuclease subunit S [Vibrio cholerae]EGR2434438.1 restriction endonuclease subunit S [Vibrio cholerae]MBJ6906680.1 restriction endonuclease subunit S [Vibrio cholerae]HBC3849039.1 restriction endonuclease subunit S [Vibrio cholerae]
MKPYPRYNQSSARWYSSFPETWSEVKAKRLFSNERERASSEDEQLAASQKYGVIPQALMMAQNNAKVMLALKGTDNFKQVKENDFVISLRSFEGGIEHSKYNGCISPAYTVLRLRHESSNPNYFRYALKCSPFIQALNSTSEGIRDGKTITYDEFGELLVALPNQAEQKAIATFLDRETQRIDSLIEEKQTFIKLLKEKRQALISHVVTKGLNPNVEMQDSGIEWIGQVPKHWGMSKVRYLGQCQNGINIGGEFFGHGTPFVSYGDVYNNTSLPEKVQGLVLSTEKDQDNYSVIAGDVLFTRTSETIEEIGFSAVCKSTIEKAVFAGFLIRFRPNEGNLDIGFSEYYFRNEKLRAFFAKEMNLVTRASLSQDLLKKMPVLLPPIDEQNEIANYLQAECNKFSEIFAETEKTILLLKERRTSLISAAVTGKIDVREAV